MGKPGGAQVNWASSQKAKVRPSPVVCNVCAYAVSGWESISRLEPERHLLLSPSLSWWANFLQPYNYRVASGFSAHSYVKGSFPSVNWQIQSQLRISPNQRCSVWDTASQSLRGIAVSGQEWGWGRRGQAGEHPLASTQVHPPGARPAQGISAHTWGPRSSQAGPGAWTRECWGVTMAGPSPSQVLV